MPDEPVGRLDRLFVPPDLGGPRVRLGVLWFLLALAAVTSGRWWTAVLAAVLAALAAYQALRCWLVAASADGAAPVPDGQRRCLLAAAGCAAAPLAAGWGTGLAGLVLLVLAGVGAAGILRPDADDAVPRGSMALATIPAAIAAVSIVLAVRLDLWAGVFVIVAVSLYDAGSFLLGAEAAGRWEGPAAGMIGALAVTFTFATVQVGPLSTGGWWAVGVLVTGSCLLGQWVAAASLPHPRAWAPALRRLDAYVVAGPVLVASLWAVGV